MNNYTELFAHVTSQNCNAHMNKHLSKALEIFDSQYQALGGNIGSVEHMQDKDSFAAYVANDLLSVINITEQDGSFIDYNHTIRPHNFTPPNLGKNISFELETETITNVTSVDPTAPGNY